jgi:16S rRNA (guanine(966)-N(2))-methyltransferase RsmD
VRVIAGRLGGRVLTAPAGRATRPTSDRVREALFSILGPLDGVALDLYAGSGALGIEALSRGCERAVFVEKDRRALAALRANLDTLGLRGNEAEVRPGDARSALRNALARGEAYDLVFLDPPYRLAAGLGGEIGEGLRGILAPGARVVCESDRRSPLGLELPLADERRYGDTLIRIHSP